MTDVRRRFTIIKWIPRLLLLAVIAFSFYVGWKYRGGKEGPSPETKIEKSNVKGQQSNIDYSHFDKGKLIYRVNADTVLTMKSDQQQLSNPEFIFYDENQKEAIRVTGKHCNISRDFNQITVVDDAFVKSAEGMAVAAHVIRYDAKLQTFSTPGVAHFKWRSLKGKSKGFTYSIPNEELELPEKPEMTYVNLAGENRKPIEMTGDRGYIDRKSGFAYFEGSVAVNQGKDKIRAHRLEAAFKPGSNDLEKLTALKDVKISFGKPGKKGQQPQEPEKKPDVVPASNTTPSMSNVFTADSESGKDLSAQFVEMFFYEDGNTISNFHSNGDCTFVLHTYDNKNSPKENRIIKGEEFHAKFDRQGDMEEFRANNKVSVKLQPLDSPKRQQVAASQTIFCEELYAKLVPESGDVKEIQFNDSFKHVQGERTVTSKRAVYAGGEQRKTDLIGEPEIQDASFNITARDMELFEETSNIHAKAHL
jgi:LPS export ABC transporter protein LptC